LQSYTKEFSGFAVVFESLFWDHNVVKTVVLRSFLVEGDKAASLGWYRTSSD